jgi:quercetin dioxygenase-like cupin family protein
MAEAGTTLTVEPGEGATTWLGGCGVVFKVPGELTQGALSVVEHPVLPGTLVPPHVHRAEDELSYVLEGVFGVRIGDKVLEAGPGTYVFKPRGVPHTFWNAGEEPARLVELIWPAGFERFFEELGAAFTAGGAPSPDLLSELAERYQVEYLMDWVPELEARYGVSVLHRGGLGDDEPIRA